MKTLLFILAVLPTAFFALAIIISAVRYIAGELNHSFKNIRRSVRDFLWRAEWELSRKG